MMMARRTIAVVALLLSICCLSVGNSSKADHNYRSDIVVADDEPLLIFTTLDGTLYGVDKGTGNTLWSLKDRPTIDNLGSSEDYLYFPDPLDGSLYVSGTHGLKRLPLTIPELVRVSPSRSSDGLLYSATKQDSWIAIDSSTGNKLYTFSSSNGMEETCPLENNQESSNILHIPQTVYRVAILDSVTKQIRWNVSYTQYGSPAYSNRVPQDLLHFCSSSDGSMLSVNALTGKTVWEKQFESPVVGVYSSEGIGNLRKVPITTVGQETLKVITGSSALAIRMEGACLNPTDKSIKPSLFVGVQSNQLYAMRSLSEESHIHKVLPPTLPHPPLLNGPTNGPIDYQDNIHSGLGHYSLPDDIEIKLAPFFQYLGIDPFQPQHSTSNTVVMETVISPVVSNLSTQGGDNEGGVVSLSVSVIVLMFGTVLFSTFFASLVAVIVAKMTSNSQKEIIQAPQSSSPSPESSKTGSSSIQSQSAISNNSVAVTNGPTTNGYSGSHTKDSNGRLSVGKISYCTQEVIGKGSQGTVVFRGVFDSRQVAVKRIIPECFDLADREVTLLRESDQHPNVVRYFCMEEDPTFRYLALELCHASLYEYVQGHKLYDVKVNETKILWEAMSGVSHLHSLGIVHRDIKPHNVLLIVNSTGCVKALISDFGLCRKLPTGRGSFTAQSGILGTEGWIAPEMFQNQTRVTCAVDIFAMGCLIYYILSRGSHPFGQPFKRQINIEAGDYTLNDLLGSDRCTAEHLVHSMICYNYNFRPSAREVLCHCLFWSAPKQLSFFQDVSDRIEKESFSSHVVQALERGGISVVKGGWKDHITEDLRQDLMRFRSYQSSSVRDLLRAMRNKKHHYRELPEDLRHSLGSIPDGYVSYFTSRFPSLLIHTYKQMELCKSETVFQSYYNTP